MERENQEYISIVNATENNLKHVSLKISEKENHRFLPVCPVRQIIALP